MLVCDEGSAARYKSTRLHRSQSACIVQIILIGVEAYHTIDNDLGLIYARYEFRHFYRFLNSVVSKHKISLNFYLKRRLLTIAWILIILNVFHATVEIIFLLPIITEEIDNQTSPAIINLPKGYAMALTMMIKAIGSIHSKATDTLIIYFSLLLIYYIRSFGSLVKDIVDAVDNLESDRPNYLKIESFDELRQAFVALQELVIKANKCMSPNIFLTITCNVIAVMGGIFVGIDIFGQGAKIEEEEAFDIFNAIISILALFFW